MTAALNTTRLADYRPPAFTVKHHELKFDLQNSGEVLVSHSQHIVRNQPSHDENGWELPQDKHLALNAEHLAFDVIEIDGTALTAGQYDYDGDGKNESYPVELTLRHQGANRVLVKYMQDSPASPYSRETLFLRKGRNVEITIKDYMS